MSHAILLLFYFLGRALSRCEQRKEAAHPWLHFTAWQHAHSQAAFTAPPVLIALTATDLPLTHQGISLNILTTAPPERQGCQGNSAQPPICPATTFSKSQMPHYPVATLRTASGIRRNFFSYLRAKPAFFNKMKLQFSSNPSSSTIFYKVIQ